MADQLKYWYDPIFFEYLCKVLEKTIPHFNKTQFINTIFDRGWPDLELKQRTRKVTRSLHQILSKDFKLAAKLIVKISEECKTNPYDGPTYPLIFLPDYIECYGINRFKESMQAIEKVTQLISAEFAIRPFIIKYPEKAMRQMLLWSTHKSHDVRRLSSEGCRPRLPWAMALPAFKKDPSPILQVLENLKTDRSEYVRKSVANNLNDIAKDHPDVVLKICKQWKGISPETDWILKHGSRTLLKQGHKAALGFHGFNAQLKSVVSNLQMDKKNIPIGSTGTFSFDLANKEKKKSKFRIEYAIHYLTSSGKKSKKVFQIAEKVLNCNEEIHFTRKQRFTDFTTRKHFPGKHRLDVIVNGEVKKSLDFKLIKSLKLNSIT